MPCYDGRDKEGRELRTLNLEQRIDYLTDLLCKQCKFVDTPDYDINLIHPEVRTWWKEHQESDKDKEDAEKSDRLFSINYKRKQMKELENEINQLSSELSK